MTHPVTHRVFHTFNYSRGKLSRIKLHFETELPNYHDHPRPTQKDRRPEPIPTTNRHDVPDANPRLYFFFLPSFPLFPQLKNRPLALADCFSVLVLLSSGSVRVRSLPVPGISVSRGSRETFEGKRSAAGTRSQTSISQPAHSIGRKNCIEREGGKLSLSLSLPLPE